MMLCTMYALLCAIWTKVHFPCQDICYIYKVSFLIRILHVDTDKITLVIDSCISIRIYVYKYTNPCVFFTR